MFVASLSFWFHFWFCVGVVLWGSFRHAVLMRWSYIRKLEWQIAVGPYVVPVDLAIRENAHEKIEGIVGECPAVIGKRRRSRRVIRQNIWEQCRRHALRLGRSISTCVLQSVREGSKETPIGRRFTSEVGISFLDKYHRLRGPGSALDLTPATTIMWRKRARPEANLFCPQSRVRYFKNDAAHIFVSEEIVARELQVVLRAFHIAEERVAAPASKEAGIACLCNLRFAP